MCVFASKSLNTKVIKLTNKWANMCSQIKLSTLIE